MQPHERGWEQASLKHIKKTPKMGAAVVVVVEFLYIKNTVGGSHCCGRRKEMVVSVIYCK